MLCLVSLDGPSVIRSEWYLRTAHGLMAHSFLALACVFVVDVIIFQGLVELAMFGCSMLGMEPHAAISIAMVNDIHFWGLRPIRAVVPDNPPNGDVFALPLREARKGEATDDEASEVDIHAWRRYTIVLERSRMDSDEVDGELALTMPREAGCLRSAR